MTIRRSTSYRDRTDVTAKHIPNSSTVRRPIIPDEVIMILMDLLPSTVQNDVTVATGNNMAPSYGPNDGYRWRLQFVDVMVEVRALLLQYKKIRAVSSDVEQSLQLQEEQGWQEQELLRRIEALMTQLRMDLNEFSTVVVPQERRTLVSYDQQITHYQQKQQLQLQQQPVIYYILRILLTQHRLRLQHEEFMLIQVLHPSLDVLYDQNDSTNNDNNNNIEDHLQFCIQTLRQPWHTKQPQFVYDMLELLLEQISQQQLEDDEEEENVGEENQIESSMATISLSSFQRQLQLYHLQQVRNKERVHRLDVGMTTESHGSNHSWTKPANTVTTTTTTSLVQQIVHESFNFIHRTNHPTSVDHDRVVTTMLIVGSVGSGKTYICNHLEEQLSLVRPSTTLVIRPRLPMDLLQQGSMLGVVEDTIISLFASIQEHTSNNRNVVVILDDIEHIVGTCRSSGINETPLVRRCRSIFMALLDFLQQRQPFREYCSKDRNVLFLLTTSCREIASSMSFHISRTFYLEPPNEGERKRVLHNFILGRNENDFTLNNVDVQKLLNDLVDLTVGKSFAEIGQMCRQSLEVVMGNELGSTTLLGNNSVNKIEVSLLTSMKELLQSKTPESLRGGEYVDGFVDMRVFSTRDLLSMNELDMSKSIRGLHSDNTAELLPSASARTAWKVLQSSIIIPLCKSKELQELLDTTKGVKPKTIVGAILLSGESGSGKTAIALRCARHVAELLPSIKLIDVSCTSMIHKEVGASEQAIHHLFDAVRRAAPAILLMDGIETIAAVRGNDATTEGTMDRILSTLLVELDGVDDNTTGSSQGGIAVIGITHDETWIDPALKRPGRLDRAIRMTRDWL